MVRLKNRYLLLDILYPDPSTWPSQNPTSTQLAIHSPTSDALTPGLLAKMIREEVGEMYGDWGVGKLGGAAATGINGISHPQTNRSCLTMLIRPFVQSNTYRPQHQPRSSAVRARHSDSSGPL